MKTGRIAHYQEDIFRMPPHSVSPVSCFRYGHYHSYLLCLIFTTTSQIWHLYLFSFGLQNNNAYSLNGLQKLLIECRVLRCYERVY